MEKLPFIFGKSTDAANFTDREEESVRLALNFKSLTNTTIISPRRWGKTSLVEAVSKTVMDESKTIKVCLLDIFNVRSEIDFYDYFAKEILKTTASRWEEMATHAKNFLAQLLPKISFSPDSQAEISFGVSWEALQKSPDDILNLAENIAKSKNIRIVVCIDEFQAIGDFPDSLAFQRKLRSHWQHHHSVAYCLYGSKRHMLLNIFSNISMPFYKFGDIMFLQKINNAVWGKFIKKRFEDSGKKIGIKTAEYLAARVDNHSYYVQQLAQQAWLRTTETCTKEIIENSLQSIKNQLSLLFIGQIEGLSATQINFLKAVLDGESAFTSRKVLQNYRLGTSGNLKKIKSALSSKEIIDIQEKKIEILDPIFKLWLKEDYFRNYLNFF
ncbi:ATP-binding protein [Proteiniphilum sp. X52]|uniref:AAA family ATPase n=1 Tax=Proteiniphilum sp. X52 TaxID=2382159 RepID=UPI000F0A4DC6|nr:P-loop NTPase fold protein [Proteiniphilum sp. X52]RNC65487.1 ATP-binding protein [Proteiniphilum sp. X52]